MMEIKSEETGEIRRGEKVNLGLRPYCTLLEWLSSSTNNHEMIPHEDRCIPLKSGEKINNLHPFTRNSFLVTQQ